MERCGCRGGDHDPCPRETNGAVAVKAWNALAKRTGHDPPIFAVQREAEKVRYRDIVAQPRAHHDPSDLERSR